MVENSYCWRNYDAISPQISVEMASPLFILASNLGQLFSQSLKAMQGKGIFHKWTIPKKYFLQRNFSFAYHGKSKEISTKGR